MHKAYYLIIISFCIVSCQIGKTNRVKRDIASIDALSVLIKQISLTTNKTPRLIEAEILNYIKFNKLSSKEMEYLGMKRNEFMGIKNLESTGPFRQRIGQWSSENLEHIFPQLSREQLISIYQKSYTKHLGYKNFYKTRSIQSKIYLRNSFILAKREFSQKLKSLAMPKVEKQFETNLDELATRSQKYPEIYPEGKMILQSAFIIAEKTGINPLGKSCPLFLKHAPLNVLKNKANLDLVRSQIVEAKSLAKNNGVPFENFSQISRSNRLTQKEIDESTVEAFQQVFKHTEIQARKALKFLKKKPCRLY